MTKSADKLEKLLNLAFHPGTGDIEAGVAFNKARKTYHEALQEKQEINISVQHKQTVKPEPPKQSKPEEPMHTKTLSIANVHRLKVDGYMVFMLDTAAMLNMFVHVTLGESSGPRLDQLILNVTMTGTLQSIARFEELLNEYVRRQNTAPPPQTPPPPPPQPERNVREFKNNAQVIANWIFIFFIALVFFGLPYLLR